ncbi:MAG: hypothetical protein HS110_04905 [Zoogloeaceae bacterium]|nr:hypothetical protein [Zoogloeaceae bacterium]MCK6385039.1 hypothetical protein [Rhodocyclaceae bacterium]
MALPLSEADLDELIAMADGACAGFGGNPDWTWPDTLLGRIVVALIGRAPTRLEVLAAARRHEERSAEAAGNDATMAASQRSSP